MTLPELLVDVTTKRTTHKLLIQGDKVARFIAKYGESHPRTQFQITKLEKLQTKLGHLTGYQL